MPIVKQITVEWKATIPTQAYGNMTVGSSWTVELEAGDNPEAVHRDLQQRQRAELLRAVLPIAKERLTALQVLLAKLPAEESKAIQQRFGVLEFLRVVAPELLFAHQGASSDDEVLEELRRHESKQVDSA